MQPEPFGGGRMRRAVINKEKRKTKVNGREHLRTAGL